MNNEKDRPDQDAREERKIKEPFRPEDTPRPPQIMDASKGPDEQDEKHTESAKDSEKKKKAE